MWKSRKQKTKQACEKILENEKNLESRRLKQKICASFEDVSKKDILPETGQTHRSHCTCGATGASCARSAVAADESADPEDEDPADEDPDDEDELEVALTPAITHCATSAARAVSKRARACHIFHASSSDR